jgi:Nitroreductase
MEFYSVVDTRRTIRDFIETPVEIDVVKRILLAGLKAPTNDHMRNWEFVVVTDKQKIASIINVIPKMPKKKKEDITISRQFSDECQQKMYVDAIPKQYEMLSKSGCLVLPFFKQSEPLLEPKALESLNYFASIWCCIENILLAATSEGLRAALRIPTGNEPEHILEILNHPKEYIMPCYIALGYPSPKATVIQQKEYNLEDKIHIDRW